LYVWRDGRIHRIADDTMAMPGVADGAKFHNFDSASADGGRIAFAGSDATFRRGIFTDLTGSLEKVLIEGDTLDGKTVTNTHMSQKGLRGGRLVISVGFADGTRALYLVSASGGGGGGEATTRPSSAGATQPPTD
jgi:hypothetical protein